MEAVPLTPTLEIAELSLATPPPSPTQPTLLPIYVRARALLRATCNSTTSIAGRDQERQLIKSFISSSDAEPSLYISGSPGTGKTALVNSVLRELDGQLGEAKIVSINCMALNNVDALWDRLCEELDNSVKRKCPGRSKKPKAREALVALLGSLQSKCILILDELDHIASTTSALTTIFSLPESSSMLSLIGIANTHTLTSSISHLPSSSQVQTVHFSPYTPTQLLNILHSRLSSLCDDTHAGQAERKKFLPQPTLMLLTKKVAALTGDVRSLLEVLRGAIDLSLAAVIPSSPSSTEPASAATLTPSVTPAHVLAALKAHAPAAKSAPASTPAGATASTSSSEVVNKVRGMGLQARLVLLFVLIASKRLETGLSLSDSSTSPSSTPRSPVKRAHSLPSPASSPSATTPRIETSGLYTFYNHVLAHGEAGVFTAVSRSEFGDLLNMLEVTGLLEQTGCAGPSSLSATPTKGKRTFGRSASFGGIGKGKAASAGGDIRLVEGVRADEVLRGLGIGMPEPAGDIDAREEEVRIIWERECRRVEKDVCIAEKRVRAAKCGDAFDEAMED
ncbi:hypothetical protein HGRIS_002805 [Hohenbuehelia grisea]